MKDKNKLKRDVQIRLRKIEGQVKGIERMVQSGSNCKDILIQIAAVRSAINKVGCIVLENCAQSCLKDYEGEGKKNIEELISNLNMFLK
ncbi:copper-sensing transcriptional repressor CsoR [Clostridium acetireducens DSM 10703]|jgi:DNA-binding FrmR family transcriptional regulator|uniref:Copper-sensing transcriptional repressor CsoR n=1 Tax=Clostridium acetireducens DSM 10703 TaxID=1121290 RepID=A0A1E8EXP4_9CLOT|nr:metal-sensitive transcriptional regulator [Clostridium acetireducens]OFI05567.1 copper-sensing transcriptional repressor CsoR [Clostridium acetireducens DSM 10703]